MNTPFDEKVSVDFPLTPSFYSQTLDSGKLAKSVGTLYGGRALGIFVYGSCALVDIDAACKYCSIKPNRSSNDDFVKVVKTEDVYNLVIRALRADGNELTQVMINGGNFTDRDKSFSYYLSICEAARRAINFMNMEDKVELHLIVYPPRNIKLIKEARSLNLSIAMNTEVFDRELFNRYCLGKMKVGGQQEIFDALGEASNFIGKGNAFSIFVGGLEPLESLEAGLEYVSKIGVIPVVNIFHADPFTPLSFHPLPSAKEIIQMGKALQDTYKQNEFARPFYYGCGRNALDTEAYRGLF